MNNMKILQLGKYYPPDIGGIENVIFDITESLNKYKNISCDVLCSNSKNIYKEEQYNGYKIIRTKSLGKLFSTSISPQMIFKLRKIIDNYDIIHVHLPDPMATLSLMLANPKKQKIILHWHSDIIKQKYLLKLFTPFQNWILNRADKIIASSPKYINESTILQKYKNKCIAIPLSVNENKFIENQDEVKNIKNTYKNKTIIFSVGRLIYYKGFNFLIKSAKYLDDDFIILIAGDGPLYKELNELILKNNLLKKVALLGKITDAELSNYYSACDIFCLPSIFKSEAFGLVQIEAMSFGKPIVATKIKGSGVDWVNKDGESGINVDICDPIELSKAFIKLSKDKEYYNLLSYGAKKRFLSTFTLNVMIKKIIKLYKSIL